jgi:thiamine monophosphate synthase
MENTNKKVSIKVNGKWRTFGTIKLNKFGHLQLSIRNSQEFKELVAGGADWLNFSLFDEDEKKERELRPDTQEKLNQLKAIARDAEIPF